MLLNIVGIRKSSFSCKIISKKFYKNLSKSSSSQSKKNPFAFLPAIDTDIALTSMLNRSFCWVINGVKILIGLLLGAKTPDGQQTDFQQDSNESCRFAPFILN